jgi:hypothetical protein
MIDRLIEKLSTSIANKINDHLLERCEILSKDNRNMYVRTKQYERKIREMREKNGKRNTRNKATRISTKK